VDLLKSNTSLDDIENSAKLPALKQLLLDCGIGTNDEVSVNQHRALVFCQLKGKEMEFVFQRISSYSVSSSSHVGYN